MLCAIAPYVIFRSLRNSSSRAANEEGAAEGINSFFSVLPKRYEKESSSASAILISARVVGTIPNSAARAITGRLTPVRSANALLEKQSLSSMIARMRFRNAAETLYSVFAGTLGILRQNFPNFDKIRQEKKIYSYHWIWYNFYCKKWNGINCYLSFYYRNI